MDPAFVERHWSDLPNLTKLRDHGSYSHLATTDPPQSPVAWSTFITGLDPSEHGIFDFVHRDPVTMEPYLSTDKTLEPRFVLPLGPYRLPLSSFTRSLVAQRSSLLGIPFRSRNSRDHHSHTRKLSALHRGPRNRRHGHARPARHTRHLHVLHRRSRRDDARSLRRPHTQRRTHRWARRVAARRSARHPSSRSVLHERQN